MFFCSAREQKSRVSRSSGSRTPPRRDDATQSAVSAKTTGKGKPNLDPNDSNHKTVFKKKHTDFSIISSVRLYLDGGGDDAETVPADDVVGSVREMKAYVSALNEYRDKMSGNLYFFFFTTPKIKIFVHSYPAKYY